MNDKSEQIFFVLLRIFVGIAIVGLMVLFLTNLGKRPSDIAFSLIAFFISVAALVMTTLQSVSILRQVKVTKKAAKLVQESSDMIELLVKEDKTMSGVYTNISASIIEMSSSSLEGIGSSYGLPKEATDRVANRAFSAKDTQKKVEKLVDEGYGWLNGQKKVFVLELDLESNKQALINGLPDELVKHIEAKPICTTDQLQAFSQGNQSSSILQTCRPQDLDISAFKNDFSQAVSAQQVPDAVSQAAASQVPVDSSTQPSGSEMPVFKLNDNKIHGVSAPFMFGIFKNMFYIILFIIIFVAAALYGLMRQTLPFMKILAHPLLTTGILLIFYALLTQWVIAQNFLSKLAPGQQTHLTEKTLQSFSLVSARIMIYFGVFYTVIALTLYIFAHRQKKKQDAQKLAQEVASTNTVV
ncbi:hypothetical protein HY004_00265 [Candidatus Saccharibacteria bacterium]|nr:hypothetical protein [Candidatus Saccharibacteria bacterium]